MQDGTNEHQSREPLLVRLRMVIWPAHQAIVASVLAVALLSMIGYFAYQSVSEAGLVDIDQASSIHVDFKVNINQAELGEIVILPGVGPKLAQAIIDYRSANGPFDSLQSLEDVSGIGPKKAQSLKPFLTSIETAE